MHHFEIDKGFNDTTVLFCKRCGISYTLVRYHSTNEEPSKTVWESMPFQDYQGKDIDPPCRPCEKSENE